MQRRAQRADQPQQRPRRVSRALVGAAAVPVMLIAAGCSSDSGSGGDAKQASESPAGASASPSPTVEAAAYGKLPEPCSVLTKKTLEDLVPEAGKSGKEGNSDDVSVRAGCSWDSLDNNGVKGSQFRWLNVSLLRFESDAARGAGEQRAREYYDKQVVDARSVEGARNTKTEQVEGTGDEAAAVRYDLKKKEGAFKQQTVVARVENVVVTVDYNGAGLAGEKTPVAGDLMKAAQKAAKEAVAAVTKANGTDASKAPDSPKSPSESPSKSAASSSKSPSKSGTSATSAAKKS
ncbi:DUF3558 family protein [Streptomyces sp. NPDC089424]|uniref:DUF3558 family protein n=1 Tax=Streptomyces sp. NPDC089424 TaxID=3365917 RepID=UPI0038138102